MDPVDYATARVAILGVGREGRAAWRYLRARFPALPITLFDEAVPEQAFALGLTALDRLQTGPFEEADLAGFDVLIRSPGVSPYRSFMRRAAAAGVRVTSPSNLWFEAHPDANTVCVTGTKGKSTTSALIAHLLQACGFDVRLAGNIGQPLLDCDDRGVDWWVIELSSYQLTDLEAEPRVSVILNLTPEHLDWHLGDDNYRRDKLRLAELAGRRTLVVNAADVALRAAFGGREGVTWFNGEQGYRADSRYLWDGAARLPVSAPPALPGRHNLSNIAAALTVVRAAGGEPDAALSALDSFVPLPHRLQWLGERDGLRFVNDSISSTPVATAAALETLAGEEVVLIVGGFDRGVDWSPYVPVFAASPPRAVIGLPASGPRIVATLQNAGIRPECGLHLAPNLEEGLGRARELSRAGGLILLSPGAPSFPQFRDFRDRGRQFAHLCGFEWDDPEAG